MQVDFYHLTAAPLDRVLPSIANKVLGTGGRLLIVSADEAQRKIIDRLLWIYAAESFLPHGCSGEGLEAAQPVLIGPDVSAENGARNVALVDGLWRDEALAFDRAFHFFDEEMIESARAAWRDLGAKDSVERRYWKQNDEGRWERAA